METFLGLLLLLCSACLLQVRGAVNEVCTQGGTQCDLTYNTECRDDGGGYLCLCRKGYKARDDLSACISNTVGDTCTDDTDCSTLIANSECPSGICKCTTGHSASPGDTVCYSTALGAGCTDNADCSTIAFAECSTTCKCKTGYRDNGGACTYNKIDDSCSADADCSIVARAACSGGLCVCEAGYNPSGEKTECNSNVIGSDCTDNTQCDAMIANSKCDTGNTGKCVCDAGHLSADGGTTCAPITIGDPCSGDDDCSSTIANSFCESTSCSCDPGFISAEAGTKCSAITIGGTCSVDDDCKSTIVNSVCDTNACACDAGFTSAEAGTKCSAITLGGTCNAGGSDCNAILHAECRDESGHKCLCIAGYEGTDGTTSCAPKNCGPPSATEGYDLGDASLTTFQSTVLVSCASGYEDYPTSNTITCLSSGDWEIPSGCTKVECGEATVSEPGYVIDSSNGINFMSEAVILCVSGYEGSPNPITCSATKSWTTPTGCSRVDCQTPDFTGYVLGTPSPDTKYESTVGVTECATGYEVSPTITSLSCLSTGEWTNPTGCNKVDCGDPTDPNVFSQTGYRVVSHTDTKYESEAVVECDTGYTGAPDAIVCQANKSWSTATGCEITVGAPCTSGGSDCDTIGNSECRDDGGFKCLCVTGYIGTDGTTSCNQIAVDAECTTVDDCSGISNVECISNSGSGLQCSCLSGFRANADKSDCIANLVDAECTTVDDCSGISNVECISNSGSGLQCSCLSGFRANADKSDCIANLLGDGCTVENVVNDCAGISNVECGNDDGSGLKCSCQTGYKAKDDNTDCLIINCGDPNQAGYVFESGTSKTYASQVDVQQCEAGYNGNPSTPQVTCGPNGLWSEAAGCLPVNCSDPSESEGYTLGTVGGTTFGQTVEVSCAVGYTGDPNPVSCGSTGQWSEMTGCEKVDCEEPPLEGYIFEDYQTTDYGSTIVVEKCANGYTGTVTTPTIQCLSTGSWSIPQQCTIVNCGNPAQPTNGNVVLSHGTEFGANATQSCDTGYKISGVQVIKCLASGSWSSQPVSCIRIDCGTLIPPLHGSVSAPSTYYDATATFSCDTGYELSGDATKKCLLSGEWSEGENTTCAIKGNCDDPPTITNAQSSLNSEGTVATYQCDDGYEFANSNNRVLTCAANNQWTGSRPQCRVPDTKRKHAITLVTPQIVIQNLNTPSVKAYWKPQVQQIMQRRYRELSSIETLIFIVLDMRSGSLIVDGEVILPDNTVATTENYLNATNDLLTNEESIEIDGQVGTFQSVTVANVTYTKDDMEGYLCTTFEQLEGQCESGSECVATSSSSSGSAECRPIAKKDNLAVIIGVGVGVPLFLLAVVICLIAGIYIRRQNRRDDKYRSESESDDQSQFARQIATRYPGRHPPSSGFDGPNYFEYDNSGYGDEPRRFNYGRDSFYNYLEPGRKLQIKRPRY